MKKSGKKQWARRFIFSEWMENGSSDVRVNLPLTICFNINPREHSIENYG